MNHMILWSRRGLDLRPLAVVFLAGSFGAFGCGSKPQPETAPASEEKAPVARAAASPVKEPSPEPPTVAPARAAVPMQRDRLHQAFSDAVLGPDNPPIDNLPPADRIITGKLGPRLLEQVRATWDDVRFVSPAGKKISYNAEIVTRHGTIQIGLFPELAPNHVRNFIVLARAGYYDGLRFDCIVRDKGEKGSLLHLEAGCPLGTGESKTGSIGYWVKDELTPPEKMMHDEGAVGACRLIEADTAATRFYINLEKAPFLDGNYTLFGKIVQGLDVARTITQQPVNPDAEDPSRARPQQPVVIHKVTIHEHQTEASEK
jgi:peptidyl-prolyl cis-trans isomerase B (cyclophilin B)